MTPADLLGLALLGVATSLGVALLAGALLAFGEECLEIEATNWPSGAAEMPRPAHPSEPSRRSHRTRL